MEKKEFDTSRLTMGAESREHLRFQGGFSENPTHRLNTAREILDAAVLKHGDGETITSENYHKIMEHARKDPRWDHLHTGGHVLEAHIKKHLGIDE